MREWEEALGFIARIVESRHDRGAPELEIIGARFNAHGPLIELGRLDEAERLLQECREIFEAHRSWVDLARTLSALAHLYHACGDAANAIVTGQDALRHAYLAAIPQDIAISHHGLGVYLCASDNGVSTALAHHLAAALIRDLVSDGRLRNSLRSVGIDFASLPSGCPLPDTTDALYAQMSEVRGARLDELVSYLGTPEKAQAALNRILTEAYELARCFQ